MDGYDLLTCRISCKIKAVGGKNAWGYGTSSGAIMSRIAQSQVHAELSRTKLMEFLLLCLCCVEVRAQGETRRMHVNLLWLGNKAADKGR